MYLVFMLGISKTENKNLCITISFAIQYSALVSVFWMGAEAVLMLKTLVINVFQETPVKFTIITSLICWGKFEAVCR